MSSLPTEISTLIFNQLLIKDLLQCQLTSKQWRINSLTHIYSYVYLRSGDDARLFIRAISNFPQLGEYIDTIDLSNIFEGGSDEIFFDEFRILETIIRHCPNIIEIICPEKDVSFWTRLMHAGIQGQLPHLKTLPDPDCTNLESYVYTALLFKNSLTSLYICGEDSLAGYQTICNQIDQFNNLQRLNFEIRSYTYLANYDGLIDKCPHLKGLTFEVDFIATQRSNEPEPETTIHPRPNIHELTCDWKLIRTESQLEYIMRKFPNLQDLKILTRDTKSVVSGPTLIKFIQYAMSRPYFSLRIIIRKEDALNIFTEFMKTKNGCKNVTIGYAESSHPSFTLWSLNLSVIMGLNLIFVSNTGDNELKHIRFLSEVGGSLRSLNLSNFYKIPDIKGKSSVSIDRLFDILQLCPLLEECTIENATYILESYRKSKYPSLKKLSILDVERSKSFGFLDSLSSNLPNLRELSLGFGHTDGKNTDPIVIDMPHFSLDLLTWCDYPVIKYASGADVYIKLKTERELRYFSGNRRVLLPVNESRYLLAIQNAQFDINCKDLKEFRIKEYNSGRLRSLIF